MREQVKRFDFFARLNDGFAELGCHESAEGSYVRYEDHERIVAALSAQQPTPAGDDAERAAFESWVISIEGSRFAYRFDRVTAGPFAGDYRDGQVQGAWNAWQARALLAKPRAALDYQPC